MAILSKIRERGLFLILIIGLALFAFVASPTDIMNFFRSKKMGLVGEINGEEITQTQFQSMIKRVKSYNPKAKDDQITEQVWNDLVKQKIYEIQLEKAGVDIGEKDLWDAIINDPSIKNSPQFQNEVGMFDEDLLRNYIQELKDNRKEDGGRQWANWLAFEDAKRQSLRQQLYLNLLKSGYYVSTPEAKTYYTTRNTTVQGKVVKLLYNSIPDSAVTISDTDVKNYIEKHRKKYTVKPARNLQFVYFKLAASEEDKQALKDELEKLKPDFARLEGPKLVEFVDVNSDIGFSDQFVDKKSISITVSDTLFKMNIGDIYGVYADKGYFKLTKLIDIKPVFQAKASHILIAYKGSRNAKESITRTKEEAKAKAEKLLRKVNAENFADMAKEESDGPTASKGGDLGIFGEGRMVPAFNDWVFSHKKGDIGMVETEFGYHIVYISDTFEGRKFAHLAKLIAPSEKTENKIFIDAETLVSEVNKGKNFEELAKEKNYQVKKASKVMKRDTQIPGLPGDSHSHIIAWAFNEDTKTGDVKRFELDKAYVVVQVSGKQKEGLMNVQDAKPIVKPILIEQKKAKLLAAKMETGSLEEIAKNENTRVINTGKISMEEPNRGLLGNDNDVVIGAMLNMKEGETLRGIAGKQGVYAIELESKTPPVEMNSYEPIKRQLNAQLRIDNNKIFEALKEISEIKDYR